MSIEIGEYTFTLVFETEARLPGFLGSTLRGSLGWSLKRLACALRQQDCGACALRARCAYAWFFETERYSDPQGGVVNARPHPFVLRVDGQGVEHLPAGGRLEFGLVLFGEGNRYLPHLFQAVREMGAAGIGSGRRHGLGRFRILRIQCSGQEVLAGHEGVLRPPARLELLDPLAPAGDADEVTVELRTPLRLKGGNRLLEDLDFPTLVRAALRRVDALEQAYGPGRPDLDRRALVGQAEAVRTVDNRITWWNLRRWSNRQRKQVSLGGMGGRITFQGGIGPFLPLLRYAEAAHIGKQTVFGLGRIGLAPR